MISNYSTSMLPTSTELMNITTHSLREAILIEIGMEVQETIAQVLPASFLMQRTKKDILSLHYAGNFRLKYLPKRIANCSPFFIDSKLVTLCSNFLFYESITRKNHRRICSGKFPHSGCFQKIRHKLLLQRR